MADLKKKGISVKGLAKPEPGGLQKTSSSDDFDLTGKREEARRIAQDKARARTLAKQQQIAERIATATEQLASAVEELSSAAEELNRSMEQIAKGAEEASGASEESRAAIVQIEKGSTQITKASEENLKKTNIIKQQIADAVAGIESLIKGVNEAASASLETAKLMAELEKQSEEIGNIVQAVVRIADQTNLLALNAAIEAARAGEHGRGFAVVADEVRNLAETSEKSARGIKDVVAEIQASVKNIVTEINQIGSNAKEETERGKIITKELQNITKKMDEFQKAVVEIDNVARQSLEEAKEFLKGAEQIASAAEELASSAEQARKGTEQQTKAFSEISSAAQELSNTAEDLKNSTDTKKSAEELAAMAEELSANIEEASSASQELAQAIEQIKTASELQAKEAQKSSERAEKLSTAAKQIEARSQQLLKDSKELASFLAENKINVDRLIENINKSADDNLKAVDNIKALEDRTRKIDKIVEAIMNVTIQTNMLAVSGSIEAARAGEHGKGFSVVAGDIRNLANESAENADKIKDMVRGLQYLITRCMQDIELAARTARSESEKAKLSSSALIKIEEDMGFIQRAMEDTLGLAQESLQAIEQAKKGVEQIASAAEEASKAIAQAAAAAEEQARGLQEISQAIEEIASLADEMQSM
jgi:methyl-accepting chemotaxis protein